MPQDLSTLIVDLANRQTEQNERILRYQESQAAEIARLTAERDALKQTMYEELEANLRIRALGNARSDEDMTTFLERLITERDALREDAARLDWLLPRISGAEFRRIGLYYGAGPDRAALDEARKALEG